MSTAGESVHANFHIPQWLSSDEWKLAYRLLFEEPLNDDRIYEGYKIIQTWYTRNDNINIGTDSTYILLFGYFQDMGISSASIIEKIFGETIIRFLNFMERNVPNFYVMGQMFDLPEVVIDFETAKKSRQLPWLKDALMCCVKFCKLSYWDITYNHQLHIENIKQQSNIINVPVLSSMPLPNQNTLRRKASNDDKIAQHPWKTDEGSNSLVRCRCGTSLRYGTPPPPFKRQKFQTLEETKKQAQELKREMEMGG